MLCHIRAFLARHGRAAARTIALIALATILSPQLHAGEQEWKQHMQRGAEAHKRGDYRGEIGALEDALREAEAFGESDTRFASTLSWLGFVYNAQGRYAEAESLHRRSLAIWEKALGPEHPDVARSLDNLAETYRAQGRHADAEPLYRRSLTILEKAFGPEHPDVAMSLNNLALLYDKQGRYAEAEPLYRRSLAIP